jgi:IS30 family transposase
MSYTQFSTAERNRLYELKTTTSLSLRAIGCELGRDVSTISRELGRTRSEEGYYLPDRAQQRMQKRRQQSKTGFSQV